MGESKHNIVLALTNNPEGHERALATLGLEGRFFPEADTLIRALVDGHHCCGLILDVKMVMSTPRESRDRLLALARNLPVMRAKTDPDTGKVEYLDHLGCFKDQTCSSPVRFRLEERIPVNLPASVSNAKDPAMADPRQGTVLDISPNGCFIAATGSILKESFVYLRLSNLKNRRPIHCAVRWTRMDKMGDKESGLGVKFIDIKKDQIGQIAASFLA